MTYQSHPQEVLNSTVAAANTSSQAQTIIGFENIGAADVDQYGGKAMNLIVMHQAGLPVPESYFVGFDPHSKYRQTGEVEERLVNEIIEAKGKLGGQIAIRSSANCEDGTDLSMAGVFETYFIQDDQDVEAAISAIYDQVASQEVDEFLQLHGISATEVRMGLVVQRLINPRIAGVAYTDVNGANMLVEYVNGFGDKLVDGESSGSTVLVNEQSIIVESAGFDHARINSNEVDQLTLLANKIKTIFGAHQDIEFAIEDDTVFILQSRPLTTELGEVNIQTTVEDTLRQTKKYLHALIAQEKLDFGTNSVVFSDANYSELLPRPTHMDIGIHTYVWGGSDDIPGSKQIGHQAMGYNVPQQATGMIQYIGGRTYFSLSRNAALYHIGFPETTEEYFASMIPEYLAKVEQEPQLAEYPQMGLFLQDPSLVDLRERFGDRAEEYYQVYLQFSEQLEIYAESFIHEYNDQLSAQHREYTEAAMSVDLDQLSTEQLADFATDILEHIRTESYVSFVRGARLGFYYSQRLESLLAQHFPDQDNKSVFSTLSQGLETSAVTNANIAIAEAETLDDAIDVAQHLIGHYSTQEMLEIRHERLIDDPSALAAYVAGIRQSGTYKKDFENQKSVRLELQKTLMAKLSPEDAEELARVIGYTQTYMAVRETAKYEFTREHLPLRKALKTLERKLGLDPDDIFYVYPRELTNLARDPNKMKHLINERRQTFINQSMIEMPNIIFERDIEELALIDDNEDKFYSAIGKFLAAGATETGVIVNVDEFEDTDAANKAISDLQALGRSVILAAKQMNLSHDPLIAQSAGLIIENAGIVAHGAQRARELGKGAIGGIRVKSLKTGTTVLFDPAKRSVERVEEE